MPEVKASRRTALLFALCYLAYSSIYIARLNLSVASAELQALALIDKAQIGAMGSLFFFTYSFGQLFNGSLGDKLNPKLMIVVGLAITGVCNVAIGFFPPYLAVLLMWGLNGYAQSMLWGPMLRIFTARYPEKKRAMAVTLLGTSVALGSVLGILFASAFTSGINVYWSFFFPGMLTLAIAAMIAAFLRTGPIPPAPKNRISMLKMFAHKDVAPMLFPAAAHGVLKDNINLWAPLFFIEMFGIDLGSMTFFVFMIPLISLVGRVIYPPLWKLFRGRDNVINNVCFALCVVFTVPLCFGGVNPIISAICLSVLSALVSVINTSMLSIYPMQFASTGNVSLVAGVLDFATYMGAGLSSLVYGVVLQYFGYAPMYVSWIVLAAASFVIIHVKERARVHAEAV